MRLTKRDRALLGAFSSDSVSDLVFWAFRYFMGRCTIANCSFAESLARGWASLDPRVAGMIHRELEEELVRDDRSRLEWQVAADKAIHDKKEAPYRCFPLGHDCDRDSWLQVIREARKGEPA